MKTESSGKISSFAKYAAGLVLAFCKCADVGWKRINFGLGDLVFNKSFDLVLSLKNFNFCNLAGSIAYNGKGLCVRAGNRSTKVDIITKV